MLYFLLGYLFLFIFRPFEIYPALGVWHVERIYMILLLLATLLSGKAKFKSHPIHYYLALFILSMLLSSLFAHNRAAAFESFLNYMKLVVLYLLVVFLVDDEETLRKVVLGYIFIMFIYVGKSAWEFFINDRNMFRMGIRRMMGIDLTFSDPNYFAASIVYSLPFAWAMLWDPINRGVVRAALVGYGLLSFVCIIYTGSRSGMVSGILFFILALLGSGRKVIGIALVAILLALAWGVMPASYKTRFESTFVKGLGQKGADASAEGRVEGLLHGVEIFKNYPVLGIGPDNFRYSWGSGISGMNAHNLYGQVLAELGGVGCATFFALVSTILIAHRRIIRRCSESVYRESDPAIPGVRSGKKGKKGFFHLLSTASLQVVLILLFNGNFGHNLYRYNWLWVAAFAICATYALDAADIRKARLAGASS